MSVLWAKDEFSRGKATRTHRLDLEQVPSQQVHRFKATDSPVHRAVEAGWPERFALLAAIVLLAAAIGIGIAVAA